MTCKSLFRYAEQAFFIPFCSLITKKQIRSIPPNVLTEQDVGLNSLFYPPDVPGVTAVDGFAANVQNIFQNMRINGDKNGTLKPIYAL